MFTSISKVKFRHNNLIAINVDCLGNSINAIKEFRKNFSVEMWGSLCGSVN